MTDGNVTHSVFVHAPCLIRFNSALINHAHYFRPEEYNRACQADRDPPPAVGMGSLTCLAPFQKFAHRTIELPNHHPRRRAPPLQQRSAVLVLDPQRLAQVLLFAFRLTSSTPPRSILPAREPYPKNAVSV